MAVGGSVGEQVKVQSSDAWGTRLENSAFRNGDLVTVRVPVAYDVTIDETTDKGRGTAQTKQSRQIRDAAGAEYYVKMLYHEYLERLHEMESGGDVAVEGTRLQAVPAKLGKPDLRATEYVQDSSGQQVHRPYQPMLAAIDKAPPWTASWR